MFAVKFSQGVILQNDTKDIVDILSCELSEIDLQSLYFWLDQAEFGDVYQKNHVSIQCVTDEKARKMAQFYGFLPEFEHIYGRIS